MVLELALGLDLWVGAPAVVLDLAKALGQIVVLHEALKKNIELVRVETGIDVTAEYGAFTVNGHPVLLEWQEAQECAKGILAVQARKKGPLPEGVERMVVSEQRTVQLLNKGLEQARNPVLATLLPKSGMREFRIE